MVCVSSKLHVGCVVCLYVCSGGGWSTCGCVVDVCHGRREEVLGGAKNKQEITTSDFDSFSSVILIFSLHSPLRLLPLLVLEG